LIVVGILIVAGIAAYFVGSGIENSARVREAADAKAQIASLRSVDHLLDANLWAYRAAAALDNRNFGVANDAVAHVVAGLNKVDPTAMGLEAAPLAALKTEAAGVKIAVATDLQSQRAQLLKLAADIDAVALQAAAKTDQAAA